MLLEVNFVKVSKTDVPIEHSTVLATVKTVNGYKPAICYYEDGRFRSDGLDITEDVFAFTYDIPICVPK